MFRIAFKVISRVPLRSSIGFSKAKPSKWLQRTWKIPNVPTNVRTYCAPQKEDIATFFENMRWNDQAYTHLPLKQGIKKSNPTPTFIVDTTRALLQTMDMQKGKPTPHLLQQIENALNGEFLDDYLYQSIMAFFLRQNNIHRAKKVFEQMKNDPSVTITYHTYNIFIKHYAQRRAFSKTQEFWKTMEDDGIKPGAVCFSSLLHLFGKGFSMSDYNELSAYMRHYRVRPDKMFYHDVIRILEKSKQYQDALNILEDITQKGFYMNQKMYTTFLRLLSKLDTERFSGELDLLGTYGFRLDNMFMVHVLECCIQTNKHSKGMEIYQRYKDELTESSFKKAELERLVRLCDR